MVVTQWLRVDVHYLEQLLDDHLVYAMVLEKGLNK